MFPGAQALSRQVRSRSTQVHVYLEHGPAGSAAQALSVGPTAASLHRPCNNARKEETSPEKPEASVSFLQVSKLIIKARTAWDKDEPSWPCAGAISSLWGSGGGMKAGDQSRGRDKASHRLPEHPAPWSSS